MTRWEKSRVTAAQNESAAALVAVRNARRLAAGAAPEVIQELDDAVAKVEKALTYLTSLQLRQDQPI